MFCKIFDSEKHGQIRVQLYWESVEYHICAPIVKFTTEEGSTYKRFPSSDKGREMAQKFFNSSTLVLAEEAADKIEPIILG